MSVRRRASRIHQTLSIPMSFKLLAQGRLSDARNIYDNKGLTDTRFGLKRFNTTSLGGAVLSVSYFKSNAGARYVLAKVAGSIYRVNESGAATLVKSGLSTTTKHRGVTLNNRHIMAVEGDGLFQYDGTTFTQLGQAAPTGASVTATSGGSLTDTHKYKVGLTFYSSVTGFESNLFESNEITAASPNLTASVASIPATAANGTIDKVRVYLKDTTDNSSYLFSSEINLGTTTATVTAEPTSTQIPPTTHSVPLAGGGKYLATFGNRLAYTGNGTFPNDVFFSEEYTPDGFDQTTTERTIFTSGQGPNTGIAVGLYDNNYLNPFLAIFKKTSISIYSELGGSPVLATLDNHVGCVSHDTIKVRDGVIYFMSENGWYRIRNGSLERKDGIPVSLGDGDIDDVFSRTGWEKELNSQNYENFFSAYYSTLNHYMTFVSEGSSNSIQRAYNFEERIGGFRAYTFKQSLNCAAEGEDSTGHQCVLIGDAVGYVYTFSNRNPHYDEDTSGSAQSIPAFAILPYVIPGDYGVTYNFRTLTLLAQNSTSSITVMAFQGYGQQRLQQFSYEFPNTDLGFTLDVSKLDEGVLTDDRVPNSYTADVSRTAESLLVGFYQDTSGASMGLISAQIDYNRNGNKNS